METWLNPKELTLQILLVTLQGLPLLVYTRTFGLKAEAPTLGGFRHRVSGVVPA